MRPFALHFGFYTPACAHSRHHASLIRGACGSHTRLSQDLLRNVPAINSLVPEPLSCFFAERGRFAKQTLKRSDRVCVRNAPRSKHYYEKRSWTRSYRFAPGPLRSSRVTDVGMNGRSPVKPGMTIGAWILRYAQDDIAGALRGGERPLEGVAEDARRWRLEAAMTM